MNQQVMLKAWQQRQGWLWLLLPLMGVYWLASSLHRKLYQWGLKPIYYSPIPVLVVGNITVGGSGKTPFIMAVVNYMQQQGIRVGVISRGYGGDTSQMPCLVDRQASPTLVGDEPCLIVQTTSVPMAVCPNRGQAIELLRHHYPDLQLIIADDGLQHHALDRDENWVILDADRGLGNGQLLPVGMLREPISRLAAANTTVVLHQRNWQSINQDLKNSLSKIKTKTSQQEPNPPLFMRLREQAIEPIFNQPLPHQTQLNPTTDTTVWAMTGIGYPTRFFNSLAKLGFRVQPQAFDDHHKFSLEDFQQALASGLPMVVTAKDAVKIRVLLQPYLNQPTLDKAKTELAVKLTGRLWVLPVTAELSPAVYAKLDEQLARLLP